MTLDTKGGSACVRWDTLPEELVLLVMYFLDSDDLSRAAVVCREWSKLSKDDRLWYALHWRTSYLVRKQLPPPFSWKEIFVKNKVVDLKWRFSKPSVVTLDGGHSGAVTSLDFQGDRLISGSDDGSMQVWELTTGKRLNPINGHSGAVWCVKMRNDIVVSGSYDKTVKKWNSRTGNCIATMRGHTSWVSCLQFDDAKIISGSWDGTLRIWNHENLVSIVPSRGASVFCLQYDGSSLVAGVDSVVRSWNLDRGVAVSQHNHARNVYCVHHTSSSGVVSGSQDGVVKLWDLRGASQGDRSPEWSLQAHSSSVMCLQVEDYKLITGSNDKTVKIWDIRTLQEVQTLYLHSAAVLALQFDADKVISASADKTVRVSNFTQHKSVHADPWRGVLADTRFSILRRLTSL